jgi:hypothetical protein
MKNRMLRRKGSGREVRGQDVDLETDIFRLEDLQLVKYY